MLRLVHLPGDPHDRLSPGEIASITAAFLTRDIQFSAHYPAFADTVIAAQNLEWIHFPSTGVDQHGFVPTLMDRGVVVTTSSGSNGAPVAQTAVTALLMLARGFPDWLDAQRRHAWERKLNDRVPRDLRGQRVLVVGLGTIGSTIARLCRAFDFEVVGIRRSGARPEDEVQVFSPAALDSILPTVDWIVLACPYSRDTHHMLNAKRLARLRQGARVINVARGALIDETALIAGLECGHLGGAYLDVFETEPLPSMSPLWSMHNVIVTPHNAGASSGNDARAAEMFFENLQRWLMGVSLANQQR